MENSQSTDAAANTDKGPQFKYLKSMSTTMTFKQPLPVYRSQNTSASGPSGGMMRIGSERLPAHEQLVSGVCGSLVNNGSANAQVFDESSNDLKSNSLHEFAQLAGYLQTRIVPGVNPVCNAQSEEQLSNDIALFMKNMRMVDAARRAQSPVDTAGLEDCQERFVIELESQGTDFHTVFKN